MLIVDFLCPFVCNKVGINRSRDHTGLEILR